MSEMALALRHSVSSLRSGRVWVYILGPALVSLVFLIVLALTLLNNLIDSFVAQPPMSWLVAWGAYWIAKVLAAMGGWLVILSLSYLLAMLLTALVVMPLMLGFLSRTDYSDLSRQGSDSLLASSWNSIWAAVLFVLGWLVTLPLWLVPGLGLLLPLFWMAWLNRRTFAYDALAAHASADEWRVLRQQQAMPLLMLGFLMAVLTHVPVIGMLAPSLAALVYIHFCLESLRRSRRGAVVSSFAA